MALELKIKRGYQEWNPSSRAWTYSLGADGKANVVLEGMPRGEKLEIKSDQAAIDRVLSIITLSGTLEIEPGGYGLGSPDTSSMTMIIQTNKRKCRYEIGEFTMAETWEKEKMPSLIRLRQVWRQLVPALGLPATAMMPSERYDKSLEYFRRKYDVPLLLK